MKVFISGIAGFLGSHLADAWLARGAEVVGCDNMSGGDRANVPHGAVCHEFDCNSLDRLVRAMRGSAIMYHCAASAHEGLSIFSPWRITQDGIAATAAVVSAACTVRVRRLIYCSSMARYGAQPVPFVESMKAMPVDPYGIGKVAGEDLVRNLCSVHGVEWVIAIPHSIYGPRQNYTDPYRNVVSIFANLMLRGRQPYIYGDGSQKRCFSHVDDCVEPLVRMGLDPKAAGEIINIGPDDEFITVLELAETLAGIIGLDLDPVFVNDRPQEVRLSTCSADKARTLLGYCPTVSLKEGLERLVSWMREMGPRPFEYTLPIEIVTAQTPETWVRRLL
jgi:UDP-glucose 4-epimerase